MLGLCMNFLLNYLVVAATLRVKHSRLMAPISTGFLFYLHTVSLLHLLRVICGLLSRLLLLLLLLLELGLTRVELQVQRDEVDRLLHDRWLDDGGIRHLLVLRETLYLLDELGQETRKLLFVEIVTLEVFD
jgi:hypothetical protein